MEFSNTTTKQGLLQLCEIYTGLGDAAISGNATLKAQFTNLINRRYDKVSSILGMTSRVSQFDDTNYLNQPFSLFDIAEGINDYQFLTDEDGNTISDITAVLLKGDTDFVKLDKLTLDDPDAELIMSPNSTNRGIPTAYIERNNTVFFNRVPNYSKVGGGKLFYKRVPSYFVASDTTKQPGFPAEHHEYLAVGASYDWSLVNQPKATVITRLEVKLKELEDALRTYARMRNPFKTVISPRRESSE